MVTGNVGAAPDLAPGRDVQLLLLSHDPAAQTQILTHCEDQIRRVLPYRPPVQSAPVS